MDTYLVHHPAALLERPIEASVFNPTNPYVLEGHVYCAAVEKPLSAFDIEQWQAHDVVRRLTDSGFCERGHKVGLPRRFRKADCALILHTRLSISEVVPANKS